MRTYYEETLSGLFSCCQLKYRLNGHKINVCPTKRVTWQRHCLWFAPPSEYQPYCSPTGTPTSCQVFCLCMTLFQDYWSQLQVCQHLRVEPVSHIVLLWQRISPLIDAHCLIVLGKVCNGRGGKGQHNLFSSWLISPVILALHQLGCNINQCSPCRLKSRVIHFLFHIFRCFNLQLTYSKY